jgi:hypothetical protein
MPRGRSTYLATCFHLFRSLTDLTTYFPRSYELVPPTKYACSFPDLLHCACILPHPFSFTQTPRVVSIITDELLPSHSRLRHVLGGWCVYFPFPPALLTQLAPRSHTTGTCKPRGHSLARTVFPVAQPTTSFVALHDQNLQG